MSHIPFDFEIPVSFFEKAAAEPGKQRRIGGIASLETRDRQGETILQRGLDFNDFLANGWFNDNHSRATEGVVGYPEGVQFFRKGQIMPNGQTAPADGHWVEGYLLDTEKANRIWELGQALQKTKRRLGFSVEGKIQKRTGPGNKIIAKALVRNVAVTNCPVHTGARMDILAKSLQVVEASEPDALEKMLGMGTATPGTGLGTQGSQTGEGAGRVLTGQSLEGKNTPPKRVESDKDEDEDEKKKTKKSLTGAEAFAWVHARLPDATPDQIGRFIEATRALKRTGKL